MEPLKLLGIPCIIAGVICLTVGVYGLAGGPGVTWEGVTGPQEGGQQASVLGIIILVAGVALTYFGFKRS